MNLQPKILLTIVYGGRLASPIARKVSKTLLSKVMTSNFKVSNNHEDAKVNIAQQKTVLSQDTYDYFTQNERPIFIRRVITKRDWLKLSKQKRLQVALDQYTEGREYHYELLESEVI